MTAAGLAVNLFAQPNYKNDKNLPAGRQITNDDGHARQPCLPAGAFAAA